MNLLNKYKPLCDAAVWWNKSRRPQSTFSIFTNCSISNSLLLAFKHPLYNKDYHNNMLFHSRAWSSSVQFFKSKLCLNVFLEEHHSSVFTLSGAFHCITRRVQTFSQLTENSGKNPILIIYYLNHFSSKNSNKTICCIFLSLECLKAPASGQSAPEGNHQSLEK